MESFSFTFPVYWFVLCIAAGLLFAALLYVRDKTFSEQPNWFLALLFTLRFLVVTAICTLLLEPFIKRTNTESKLPIVVVAQDVSASVGADMTEEQQTVLQSALEGIPQATGQDFSIKFYSFGDEVRPGLIDSFEDKSTNIGAPLQAVYDLYSDQNLGAVVVATDGRYNQGSNPLYLAEKLGAPVFPILLGDSIPKKDLVLKRVYHNKIAYLGDRFQVQVDIGARSLAGSTTRLRLSRVTSNGLQRVEERSIEIGSNDFFQTLEFELEAVNSGVQQYRFALQPLDGEVSPTNNRKDIYIDVLDARQKILVLASAPHPDLTALRQTLLKGKNYEVTVAYANKPPQNFRDFDFVIFHGIPTSSRVSDLLIGQVNEAELPRLFILTGESNLNRFNQAQGLMRILGDANSSNEVQAIPAQGFNLFTLSDPLRNGLPNFAPLSAPFGEYSLSPTASVVLYQRIGRVDTRFPLLVLGEERGLRTGVLAAEGLWKWRMYDFLQHDNHDLFEELVGKTLQYISLKDDKRRFRVSLPKNLFQETEAIPFNAELYNENYELVNQPDVLLNLSSDDSGDSFSFTFDKVGKVYGLNVGQFPVGNYRYEASTELNGEVFQAEGKFSVQPIQLELYETTADFGGLRLLAQRTGGKAFFPGEINELGNTLDQLPGLKPVVYSNTETYPLLNLKWLFFLMVALLTAEWFLRRYFGAY